MISQTWALDFPIIKSTNYNSQLCTTLFLDYSSVNLMQPMIQRGEEVDAACQVKPHIK